jgi:crossover junction endodeoxyribonuclease RuvC
MNIILGIDPGSQITGYGVIRSDGQKHVYIASGAIIVRTKTMPVRLVEIFRAISTIIAQYAPQQAAIEQVFMAKNANSALKLGQARGAAIVAMAQQNLPIHEYSARSVKQAVVGYGGAAKEQVQQMVKLLLGLNQIPQPDAADALAIAICHAQTRDMAALLSGELI